MGTILDGGRLEDAGRIEDGGHAHDGGHLEDAGRTDDSGHAQDAGRLEDAGRTDDGGHAQDAGRLEDAGRTDDGGSVVPPADGGPDAGRSLLFFSDWRHSRGNDTNAITDGMAWNETFWCGRDDVLWSVPAAPLGWTRSANVMQVRMLGVNACRAFQVRNVVPLATSHFGRMYFRNDETEMQTSLHNFSYNFVGQIQVVFFNRYANPTGTGWHLNFWVANGTGNTYPVNYWYAQHRSGGPQHLRSFANQTWYRYEWHIEYLAGGARFRFWPRLYDTAGVLVADHRDFYHQDTANTGLEPSFETLAEWYGLGNSFAVQDAALMRHIGIGNEGRLGSPNNNQAWYVANFAIDTAGWIGP